MGRDLTLSAVLCWLIVAAAAYGVLSLLAGWRSGASHPAVSVTFGQAPFSTAIMIAPADVTMIALVAA